MEISVFMFGVLSSMLSSIYGYNHQMASFPLAYPTPLLRPNNLQPRPERQNLPRIIFLKQLLELECLKKHMKDNHLNAQNSDGNNDFARRKFLMHRKVGVVPKEAENRPEIYENRKEVQGGWKKGSGDRMPQTFEIVQSEKKVPMGISKEVPPSLMSGFGGDDRQKFPQGSQHVWYEPRPDKIQPYKVEETIEEDISVRIDNDDIKEATKTKNKQEKNILNESISAILKGLISGPKTEAAHMRTKTGKKIIATDENKTATPRHNIKEKVEHNKSTYNSDKQTIEEIGFRSFGLINDTHELYNNRMNIQPEAQKTAVEIPIHRQQTQSANLEKAKINNTLRTASMTQNVTMNSTKQPTDKINTSTSTTTTAKTPTVTISTVQKSTSKFSKYFNTKLEKAETSIMPVKTEPPSTESTKPRSTSRFSKYFRTRIPNVRARTSRMTSETTTETSTTTTTMQNFYRTSGMSDVLSKLTTPTYKNNNDYPMAVDLLETTEGSKWSWRNSKKMYADEDINGIVQTEQRRSDILITDYGNNMNEVTDAGYLDVIKQNRTSAIFSYIPAVISDLRKEKISADDKVFLSEIFGKYWRYITWLSNQTNLDMLPLMKIKNENDFESIMANFNLEDQQTTVAVKQEVNDQIYDYIEEYKDLYKMLEQDLREKKEIAKIRLKRHDDISKEYFESIEQEHDGRRNDYVYEDIMYNDYSAGDEDSDDNSILELMKIADFHFNLRNLSSRVRKI